jgi:pimeloyl-ACP methyl ester carboxylesterase
MRIRVRVHGTTARPTLIYLPGLHGDWSLIGAFREALGTSVRFVEIAYPPTSTWSLSDYAAAVEEALRTNGISGGWLLGESFSSQVVWPLLARQELNIEGVILAGGFGRHPCCWAARLGECLLGSMPLSMLRALLRVYASVSAWRFRRHPDTADEILGLICRFNDPERKAAQHRLALIAGNQPLDLVSCVKVPIYALTGFWDPIVPWPAARHGLRHHCPTLSDYRVIWRADHNVLGTGSETAARLVLQWIHGEKHGPAAMQNKDWADPRS